MRLVITNGVQQGRVLRLKPGVNRIGRSIDNHIQVPDPSVSSVHCELIYSDAGISVRDLHSTNGTFIAGEQIQEGNAEIGQLLQLGNIELRVEPADGNVATLAINIPELSVEREAASSTLADGAPACANHSEVPGAFRCLTCGQALCHSCVRVIHRVSGEAMVFCSLCTGQCEPILPPTPVAVGNAPKKSFFGRLTDTLRLPFKRPPAPPEEAQK